MRAVLIWIYKLGTCDLVNWMNLINLLYSWAIRSLSWATLRN